METGHLIHTLLKRRFGHESGKASHLWIRRQTGKCHVAELSERERNKVIRRLKCSNRVRDSIWHKLELEKCGR